VVVFAIALLVKKLSRIDEKTYRRIVKWGGLVVLLIAAILLLRAGLPVIAAAVGGLGVLLPRLMQLLRLFGMIKMFRGLFGGKRATSNAQGQRSASAASASGMTKAKAAEILGVKETATPKEIKTRYQHLMKQVHPDKGGSEHFASQLNEAKDLLLK